MTCPILVRPDPTAASEPMRLTPGQAGWEHLGFRALDLAAGARAEHDGTGVEAAIVVLAGRVRVVSGDRAWELGSRLAVFDGRPDSLYLPPGHGAAIEALGAAQIAICTAVASPPSPIGASQASQASQTSQGSRADPALLAEPRRIPPQDVRVEVRGGRNATRIIHHILEPEFPAHKLMVVEVFTPSGNWSSYPPHKHDEHHLPDEADLEEIYYYRIDRPEGFAIQRVYTDDGRLDETLTVRDGDLVRVPEGYHPVVAPPGYHVYYLNALAGSARTMAATDDPDLAWVRGPWGSPELPGALAPLARG